jgi:CxxC motif-containing protein (DUF1111 family)
MKMKPTILAAVSVLGLAVVASRQHVFSAPPSVPGPEAVADFTGLSNGLVDDATHTNVDQVNFEEVEHLADGLGPLFNLDRCVACHQSPITGGGSQVTELRAGHREHGKFVAATVTIAHGADRITDRSLINDRAICPNAQFPDEEITEHVPNRENIRTLRLSLSLLGDGLVESVTDADLREIARRQCAGKHGVCGEIVEVPILEAPSHTEVGRFGWKDQHRSLLSFSADAYLNEMGITNTLQPQEVTTVCNPPNIPEPNSVAASTGLADIDRFARFIRATRAPARGSITAQVDHGAQIFATIGCAECHVPSLKTASTGTPINGGTFTVPAALGGLVFHPFGDFLLHNIGTGDGVVQTQMEHFGRAYVGEWKGYSQSTANKMRTAPLWGLRLRTRLMHDGASLTLRDAIARHRREAEHARVGFDKLNTADRAAVLAFLGSP